MSTVTELNAILVECCERLVDGASHVKDLGILKEEKAIYKLGKAIAEINEVRTLLYHLHPEMKPALWDASPSEEHYVEWFEEAKRIAEECCAEGNPAQAIATFESFLFIGPVESVASLARQEIARLRREYGV